MGAVAFEGNFSVPFPPATPAEGGLVGAVAITGDLLAPVPEVGAAAAPLPLGPKVLSLPVDSAIVTLQ